MEAAKARFADEKVSSRCKLLAADLTQSVPAGADVYMLKHLLHGRRDAEAITILKNCRAVIPQMVKQGRGKIINVASGYGLRGGKHNYMYACSKGGTIQLTRSMALTYAQNNIQTNCIVPGIFPHKMCSCVRWLLARADGLFPHA